MKRDQLKDLGLNEDQIKAVMDINGEDINKAKTGNDEISKENESLKAQLSERDKDLKKFQAQIKDNEEASTQLQELREKYKQDTKNLTDQIAQVKLTGAVDRALSANKVRNTKTMKGLIDMDKVKLDDQGNLTGLDDQIAAIKKTDGYLFDEGEKQSYSPSNGKPAESDPVQAMVDVFKE